MVGGDSGCEVGVRERREAGEEWAKHRADGTANNTVQNFTNVGTYRVR